MADSFVYREAVNRLKRLLYVDMPLDEEKWPSKYEATDENYWKKYSMKEKDGEDGHHDSSFDVPQLKHFSDRSDHDPDKDRTTSILLSMLKRQEGLLDELEKKNYLLKDELVTAAEAVKEVAKQNEELRAKLKDSILQIQPSPENSRAEDEAAEEEEKRQEIITCLKEEKNQMAEMIRLQEETISSLRLREAQALDKIRQALCLAEDSQEISVKAKEREDSALEELKKCVSRISGERKKEDDETESDPSTLQNLNEILSKLRQEKLAEENRHRKREMELEKRIQTLQNSLKDSEEGKQRIEKLVKEQRNTAEDAFKRMDALLEKRNMELESTNERLRNLERQLNEARAENARLLQAINDFAKYGLRASNTDDKKLESQNGEGSINPNLSSDSTKDDQMIQTAPEKDSSDHNGSVSSLQKQLEMIQSDMSNQIDCIKKRLNELHQSIQTQPIDSPNQEQPEGGKTVLPNFAHDETKATNADESDQSPTENAEEPESGKQKTGRESGKDDPRNNVYDNLEKERSKELDEFLKDPIVLKDDDKDNLNGGNNAGDGVEELIPLSPEIISEVSEEMNKIQDNVENQTQRIARLTQTILSLPILNNDCNEAPPYSAIPSPLQEIPEENLSSDYSFA